MPAVGGENHPRAATGQVGGIQPIRIVRVGAEHAEAAGDSIGIVDLGPGSACGRPGVRPDRIVAGAGALAGLEEKNVVVAAVHRRPHTAGVRTGRLTERSPHDRVRRDVGGDVEAGGRDQRDAVRAEPRQSPREGEAGNGAARVGVDLRGLPV